MNDSACKNFSLLSLSKGLSAGIILAAGLLIPDAATGQGQGLSGKQVVETVCANCHAAGVDGAPKIGDVQAWKARTAQGLTSMSQNALMGLRKMPPHGGNPGLSDADIKRAITYMVNQSGGRWTEPVETATALHERSGEQIVNAQCIKCHENSTDGAPKIGDLVAWAPRFARGTDVVVRSAIHGHGAMPARGGMADLTDTEMRSAALFMFLKGIVSVDERLVAKAKTQDPNHRIVEGMDVYLGVASAESIRAKQLTSDKQGMMSVPSGKGYYHVNISLFNRETGVEVKDAKIELSVEDPVMGEQTKKLNSMSFNGATSYGNYFRMPDKYTYRITAAINWPGQPGTTKAKFDFRPM